MHFDDYAKVIGETLFEAKVKAEKTYGKDNFQVINSKRIKHPIYFGLGHKEMFEVTIGIKNKKPKKNIVTEIPSRPSPSIEVSSPRTSFATYPESADYFSKTSDSKEIKMPPPPYTDAAKPKIVKPVNPAFHGMQAYNSTLKANRQASMRPVHGLRSNQEGNAEPHAQKILDDKYIAPEQIDEILNEIIAVKETRKRQDKIANQVKAKSTTEQRQFRCPNTPTADNSRLDYYEQRLSEMFEILRNMNQRFGKALEKEIPEMPEGLYYVKKNLLEMETPPEIADKLVFQLKEELPNIALQNPSEALRYTSNWLGKSIKISPEPDFRDSQGPKIIALIGPTGVGKTTTIAKIAASYVLNMERRLSVALFTLDTYRIGATDQLQQYAQIIDVEMEILYKPEDIDAVLPKHLEKDLIIVDTAGRCQKDTEELCELRSYLERLPNPNKYLVLSATAKYTDMLETVQCFDRIGFDHLIFTKIDETNTFGPLLGVLYKTGKSLAYYTIGQKVPEDFRKADCNFFRSRLFPANKMVDL
ncbi:MAG: hypothetical protein Kow0029_02700 [Candidatus Rifleibacteriota bacterium]